MTGRHRRRTAVYACIPLLAAGCFWWWLPHFGAHHPPHPRPTPTVSPTPAPTPTVTTPAPPPPSPPGAGVHPLPAALAGSTLVATVTPQQLASAPWAPGFDEAGNCHVQNHSAHVNAAGYAEIDTTGTGGDCTTIESPALVSTAPGAVYEAEISISSFRDWAALWLYGSPVWPDDGEIDAVEGLGGRNFVTWHAAGNRTIGTGSFANQQVPALAPNIPAGTWTVVDIAFTSTGVDIYYAGRLYAHIPETLTAAGHDPMYLVIDTGDCNSAANGNVCDGGSSPAGSVQVKSLREFR